MMRACVAWLACAAALLAAMSASATAGSAVSCAQLAKLSLPQTRILSAQPVRAGSFMPPGATKALEELPPFCRVRALIAPAVHFELWLPLESWNGKFEGTGNGGYNGAIVYRDLAAGVRRHYATANTDMGHASTAPDPGSWALHHPELVIDQGYRAQHETAVRSKQIIRAFYGRGPARSYFVGCSAGGWQGLTEAQRFPHEYDGIVAGAPASGVIHLHAATLWTHLAALQIKPEKFPLITQAVLARCNAADGLKDHLLADPRRCDFAPAELACRAGQSPEACLTPVEVSALQRIYDGAHTSSGRQIYPGWARGAEYALVAMRQPAVAALAASTFRDMVFGDANWDYHTIDFDRDVQLADEKVGGVLNNDSADLTAFRRAGGKLILWHGWDDPLISPLHTVQYYEKLAAFFAPPGVGDGASVAKLHDFARLFLAPGVNHCRGGPGPDSFDALGALEAWVERGEAPDQIVAAHLTDGVVDRTRPLCAYPEVAAYGGSGSTDLAASFSCRTP